MLVELLVARARLFGFSEPGLLKRTSKHPWTCSEPNYNQSRIGVKPFVVERGNRDLVHREVIWATNPCTLYITALSICIDHGGEDLVWTSDTWFFDEKTFQSVDGCRATWFGTTPAWVDVTAQHVMKLCKGSVNQRLHDTNIAFNF